LHKYFDFAYSVGRASEPRTGDYRKIASHDLLSAAGLALSSSYFAVIHKAEKPKRFFSVPQDVSLLCGVGCRETLEDRSA